MNAGTLCAQAIRPHGNCGVRHGSRVAPSRRAPYARCWAAQGDEDDIDAILAGIKLSGEGRGDDVVVTAAAPPPSARTNFTVTAAHQSQVLPMRRRPELHLLSLRQLRVDP
jgi:hypothetical protein